MFMIFDRKNYYYVHARPSSRLRLLHVRSVSYCHTSASARRLELPDSAVFDVVRRDSLSPPSFVASE